MNLTDEQMDLLRLLVEQHKARGGPEFMLIRGRTGLYLQYRGLPDISVAADVSDFLQLKYARAITFHEVQIRVYRGKPTQDGIDAVKARIVGSGGSSEQRISAIPGLEGIKAALDRGDRPGAVELWKANGLPGKRTNEVLFTQAGQDKSEFYRWQRGELPDGSQADLDIRQVLLTPLS